MFASSTFSSVPLASAPGLIYDTALVDIASVVDAGSAGVAFSTVFNDVVGGAVQNEGRLVFSNSFVDGTSLAQESASSLLVYGASVIEQAAAARPPGVIGLGFAVGSFSSGAFSGSGDEVTELSGDVFSSNITVAKVFTSSVQVTDRPSVGITLQKSFSDAAATQDLVSSIPEYAGVTQDSASVVDEVSSIPKYGVRVNESTTALSQVPALVSLDCTVVNIALGVEALLTTVEVNSVVAAALRGREFVLAQTIVPVSVVHTVNIADPLLARLQWENIDTLETVNWITVTAADSVDWELIATDSVDWELIKTNL